MTVHWFALLLVFAAARLVAQPLPDRLAEILAERERVSILLDRQEEGCQHRFAVTDCVNAVRKRRREILVPLQREENQLRLMERQDRDRERGRRESEKKEAFGSTYLPAETVSVDRLQETSRITEKMRSHHAQAAARTSAKSPASPKTPVNSRTEASNRDAFAKKTEALLKRQQERDQRIKLRSEPVVPLPPPP